jgi:hypothetical protein
MRQPPHLAPPRRRRNHPTRRACADIAAIMPALGPIRLTISGGLFIIRRDRCFPGFLSFLIGGIPGIGEFAARRLIAGDGKLNNTPRFSPVSRQQVMIVATIGCVNGFCAFIHAAFTSLSLI